MEYLKALKTNFHPKKSYRYFALNSAAQLMVNSVNFCYTVLTGLWTLGNWEIR